MDSMKRDTSILFSNISLIFASHGFPVHFASHMGSKVDRKLFASEDVSYYESKFLSVFQTLEVFTWFIVRFNPLTIYSFSLLCAIV